MQEAEEEVSSAMADLASAAAQMDAEAGETIDDAGEAAQKRRKRGTKLEVAQRKVSEAQAQLKIFQEKYAAFIAATVASFGRGLDFSVSIICSSVSLTRRADPVAFLEFVARL